MVSFNHVLEENEYTHAQLQIETSIARNLRDRLVDNAEELGAQEAGSVVARGDIKISKQVITGHLVAL